MRTNKDFSYPGAELKRRWRRLHEGDREPFPSSADLQDAWRAFHRGDFTAAIREGAALGARGVAVANKAAAIQTLYLEKNESRRLVMLREAIERGEEAVKQREDDANAHYALALVLGRYSQRISILEALAAGHGARIRDHLERTLVLEPHHAEAHIALGLYHAELVKTLGAIAARLTYGASAKSSIEHFHRALTLAPHSLIARIEFAHGLSLLDRDAHREQIDALHDDAAKLRPMDRTEQLDLEHLLHHRSQRTMAG